MSSNYPPGVTGNEPQITGEWPDQDPLVLAMVEYMLDKARSAAELRAAIDQAIELIEVNPKLTSVKDLEVEEAEYCSRCQEEKSGGGCVCEPDYDRIDEEKEEAQ